MAIEIRELRPHDHREVLALLSGGERQVSDAAYPQKLPKQTGLSVVARDDGEVVGAALCAPIDGGYQHQVTVTEPHRRTPLVRQIIDKALSKLLAVGAGRCNIRLLDRNEEEGFWESVVWITSAARSIEPAADGTEPPAADASDRRGSLDPAEGLQERS